ncbi:SDR family oxidoreductase [Pseudoxanthomonas sp. JBR18]|uniref:SDR family NAD(P)-dependent oxidoreductase n=1 Tax=Pseudoxanthomonas sp. JBR18 TaxID=2969308 RepID=UPI002304D5D0|nr:SDR family oxidoreductase [Pseudoxanthomonas sp. JBR18]WCE03772.1 SDR family NAD(P)-dependent oxidoreductase [Pseudoxanthomonas sp. JBR18]
MQHIQKPLAKVILITGAGRGIGAALAVAAASEGHYVAVNYRSQSAEVDQLVSCLNDGIGIRADVSIAEDAQRLINETLAHFGRIDCVINNAGIGEVCPIDRLDLAHFQKTLHANLTSAFLVSQAAWPHMTRDGGRLIFMSSAAARTGGGLSAAYAASKGGVESLMHAYATALRQHRITANAIAPALIESRMAKAIASGPTENLPLGRLGRPEELWPATRMIIETEYLTGQTIHVDAGRFMT